jgi:uncharacterized protein YcbX
MQPRLIGRVVQLWRYPVKSMRGERLASLTLTERGIAGDRLFAIRSRGAPAGLPFVTAAERAALLRLHSSTAADGSVCIGLPDDSTVNLSTADRPCTPAERAIAAVKMEAAIRQSGTATTSFTLTQSSEPQTDVRPIAVVTLQAIEQVQRETGLPFDPQRLRSNLVLDLDEARLADALLYAHRPRQNSHEIVTVQQVDSDSFAEGMLAGCTLRIGDAAKLSITEAIPRCRVVSLIPTDGTLDPRLMQHLARHHNTRIGLYARTLHTGVIHEGDAITLIR